MEPIHSITKTPTEIMVIYAIELHFNLLRFEHHLRRHLQTKTVAEVQVQYPQQKSPFGCEKNEKKKTIK